MKFPEPKFLFSKAEIKTFYSNLMILLYWVRIFVSTGNLYGKLSLLINSNLKSQ